MEQLSTKIARELVKKFPNSPKLTLAKKLYKDNPKVFTSVESARNIVNRIKGLSGSKKVTDKSLFQEPKYNYNPFILSPCSTNNLPK